MWKIADLLTLSWESGLLDKSLIPIQWKPTAVACVGDSNWQLLTKVDPSLPSL